MDALRKENESLREFRDKKKVYDRELAQVKADYVAKMRNAESDAKRKRLKDLLSLLSVTGYRVHTDYREGPKCDKCDDHRIIHFVSPVGRKMTEYCSCATKMLIHSPKAVQLFSFYAGDKLSSVYYEMTSKDEDYDRYDMCGELYDRDKTKPFEEINAYRVVFLREEDCQQYCDWLNEMEAKKNEP